MQEGAGPEWYLIDQPTLEEVEKSWAHSRCREVEFGISVSMCVCVRQVKDHKRNPSGVAVTPTTDNESIQSEPNLGRHSPQTYDTYATATLML